jgi:type III secretion protein J
MKAEAGTMARRAAKAGLPLGMAVLALSACERRVELQLAPDARRASEIAAALAGQGIVVDRKREKSGVMLSIADSDLPRAISALRDAGLSRAARPSIDEALGARGIAPTPLEARARFIHAIERQLEATLMEIDGVVGARVSAVSSERPAPGAPLAPASASVLVKHRADVDLSALVPGIARLVKNAVPGLAAEDDRHVTVMLLVEPRPPGPLVHPAAARSVPAALGSILLACAAAGAGYFADRVLHLFRQRRANARGKGNADGPIVG